MTQIEQEASAKESYILTAHCKAASGVVAAVTSYLAEQHCYICSLEQFDDEDSQQFFMRAVFRAEGETANLNHISKGFAPIAKSLAMGWKIRNSKQATNVIIMVSKFDHCLADLLYRHSKGDINMNIVAVVSNHLDLRPMAEREGIRFVYLPVNKDNKAEQEQRLLELVKDTKAELVILARYMQILSNGLTAELNGRCINIHHSFLPGFKGAKPYHQAFDRGVKLIGATAHYVTTDLDEGPIIEQVVTRVSHNHKPSDLIKMGRDNECIALARAVKYHTEQRVFLDGNKTVVFLGS